MLLDKVPSSGNTESLSVWHRLLKRHKTLNEIFTKVFGSTVVTFFLFIFVIKYYSDLSLSMGLIS